MPVAMQGTVSTFETASGTTAVIPYPAGILAGELLLAHVMCSTNAIQTTPPSGWTYYGGQVGGSSTSGPSATIYYKVATGSESGSVTFPGQSSASRITGYMTRWAGVDTTTPFDVPLVSNAAWASIFTMPAISTVNADVMLVHQLGISSTSSFDIATLAGTTKIAGSTGTGRRHSIFYEAKATAGSTGTRNWELANGASASTTQNWSGITIALRPSTSGPTPFRKGVASVYENGSTTSAVIPYPSGIMAGELLTAHITHAAPSAPTTNPGGWVLAASQNASTTRTQEPSSAVWYKIASGSESGTSVTFVTDGSAGSVTGVINRWGNIEASGPMDATPTSAVHAGTFSIITPPPVTTSTENAMIVHMVAMETSASADFDTPTGLTKVSTSTGVGRRQVIFTEVQELPGLATERTFSITPSDPPRPMHAISIAIKPGASGGGGDNPDPGGGGDGGDDGPVGPQPGSSPTLVQRMTGIPAEPKTNAVVQVQVTGATALRLRVSTDAAGTTGVKYGTSFTPDSMGNARLTVGGLTPDTRYYYRVMMTNTVGGEFADILTTVGRLRTAPNGPASFSFCFASCMVNTNSASLRAIAARASTDAFFLHLGDFLYADGSGTGISNFRTRYNDRIRLADSQAVYAQMGMSYTPSDHDGMNNNGAAGSDPTAWANWNTMRNELFPMPASYYSWAWGRVRFIQIDTRSFKSNPSNTDNSSKSALGATQKQWLKDQITNMTEGVAVIIQDAPWIASPDAGGDSWDGYVTERSELANFFIASGKHITMLSGDAHSVCADSGVNSPGGIAVFHGSPLVNNSSIKGGPYSAGVWPSSAGVSNVSAYGRITVTDTGGTTITLAYQGLEGNNTVRISLTKNYTVAPAGIGNVSGASAVAEADFPPPTVEVTAGPSIIGATRAIASAAAYPVVVEASFAPSVVAPRGQVTTEARIASVTSGINTSAVRAIATAQAHAPTVEAIGGAGVTAPVATSSVAVVPPFVLAQYGANVSVAVSSVSFVGANPPTIFGEVTSTVFADVAAGYSDALDAIVTGLVAVTVSAPVPQPVITRAFNPIFGAGSGITLPIAITQVRALVPNATVGFTVEAVAATASAAALPVVTGLAPIVEPPMIQVLVIPRSPLATGDALVTAVAATVTVATQSIIMVEGFAEVLAPAATVGIVPFEGIVVTHGSNMTVPIATSTANAPVPFAQGSGAVTIFSPAALSYAAGRTSGVSANLPVEARVTRIQVAPGGPIVRGSISVVGKTAGAAASAGTPYISVEAFVDQNTVAVIAVALSGVLIEAHIDVVATRGTVAARAYSPYLPAMEVWPIRWPLGFDPEAYDPYLVARAKEAAVNSMRMLTMYRVGGLPITVMPTSSQCTQPFTGGQFGNSYLPFYPILLETGQYANCFCADDCGCAPVQGVLLREPVGDIRSVQINGEVLESTAYRIENGNRLVRTDGGSWPSCAGDGFTVSYLNAFPVDEQGQFAAGVLAVEYIKLFTRAPGCRLPAHVTDVSRNGMSFSVSTQMFPDGTTGIDEVDTWLVQWNPNGLRVQPGVWSPDIDDHRQITWRP